MYTSVDRELSQTQKQLWKSKRTTEPMLRQSSWMRRISVAILTLIDTPSSLLPHCHDDCIVR